MSAIETASPRASSSPRTSWSASETAPRISEEAVIIYILILHENFLLGKSCPQSRTQTKSRRPGRGGA